MMLNFGLYLTAIPSTYPVGMWHYHRFDLQGRGRESEPELVDKFETPEKAIDEGLLWTFKNIIK
jgi:hypothetical protein